MSATTADYITIVSLSIVLYCLHRVPIEKKSISVENFQLATPQAIAIKINSYIPKIKRIYSYAAAIFIIKTMIPYFVKLFKLSSSQGKSDLKTWRDDGSLLMVFIYMYDYALIHSLRKFDTSTMDSDLQLILKADPRYYERTDYYRECLFKIFIFWKALQSLPAPIYNGVKTLVVSVVQGMTLNQPLPAGLTAQNVADWILDPNKVLYSLFSDVIGNLKPS